MKAGDMYAGQEVAFKQNSWDHDRDLSHGKILNVATGGGQGQKHLVEMVNDAGLGTGEKFSVIGRWIVEPWHDYKARMGEWLDQKTENEFKLKLKQDMIALHVKQAEEIQMKLALLGIEATVHQAGFDPNNDDSFGAFLRIQHLDNIQAFVNEAVQRKFAGP